MKKIRKKRVPIGNTVMEPCTMADRVSKIFAGVPGGSFYKKRPMVAESKKTKFELLNKAMFSYNIQASGILWQYPDPSR